MTISTELRKAGPFAGNGATTAFPFSFKVFAATDVTVTRADTLGAETGLVLNTDFTVALNADQDAAPGGTVTLAAPLSTGYRLVVSSAVPNLQPTDITNNGGFYPRVIEDALDRQVAQIQQIDEKVKRALKVAVTSPLGDQALPSPVGGMLIGWNESNDGLTNYAPIGGTLLGQQLAAANGSSLVGFQQAGTGAVVRTAQDKMREWVSVTDFYANGVSGARVDPTGVIDSTAGIQAAIDSLVSATGGTVKIPPGHYKITSTINVGLPTLSGFQFLTTRTSELTDPMVSANTIAANVTANKSKKHVNIVFEPGAVLVAYWTPDTDTPVLSYNLQQGSSPGHGRIVNPTIVSSAMLTAGVYNRDAVTTPQTNNLIAIFAASGAKHIENVFVSGVEHGIVSFGGFWTRITDVYVWWAGGRCLDIAMGNALKAENLAFWYSANGLVFDGDSSEICGIHTEQVAQDITIYKADCSTFGHAYLEDVETADGTGTNAVTLGYVNNGIKITHCRFEGIRIGAMRPNKGAMRIWDVAHGILSGVRAYGKTVTRDTNSTLVYENVDFSPTVPDTKTVVVGGGSTRWASNSPTGSQYTSHGPWLFSLVGIATGSIAANASANYDFTLPTSLDSVSNASAFASYVSGGDAMLTLTTRILFTTPKKVRITFANPTSGAIDPGSANLCLAVVAGI